LSKFLLADVEAILFDCDGVLVDSEYLSTNALNIVFENEFNIDIGRDYTPVIGTSLATALKYYLDLHHIKEFDLDDLKLKKEQAYFQQAKERLRSFDGCDEFLTLVKKKGLKIAVASSGSHEKINFSLTTTGLKNYFEIFCSADDVMKGKPAPDLFIAAASKVGVSPEKCIVIEDSVNGIKATKAAKMYAIGFLGSFDQQTLFQAGADLVVNGYKNLIELF